MVFRPGCRALLGALLCLLMLPSSTSFAQSSEPTTMSAEEKREKAAKIFEEADAFYQLQEYEKALSGYREAYLLSLEPALLFNIGQCYRLLGRYEESLKSYQAFLRSEPEEALRKEVEGLIQEVEAKIAEKKAASQPTSSSLPTSGPTPTTPMHTWLYRGSLGAGALSLGMGALSLLSASRAKALQNEGAPLADFQGPVRRARLTGLVSDVFLVAALGGAATGYYLERSSKEEPLITPDILYKGAAVSGAAGLLSGGAAILVATRARRLQSQGDILAEETAQKSALSRRLGLISDFFLLAAAAGGGAGYFLGRQQNTKISASVGPGGASLSLTF